MIISKCMGRLGNQMFIYSTAVGALQPNEKLTLVGFNALVRLFPEIQTLHRWIPHRSKLQTVIHRTMILLARWRIFGLVQATPDRSHIERLRGVFSVTMVDVDFFQNEALSPVEPLLSLTNHRISDRVDLLARLQVDEMITAGKKLCFVHVRRGDYLYWPSPEYPAALPASWYIEQMRRIQEGSPDTHFLVFSDDIDYCREAIPAAQNVTHIDAEVEDTFLAMSICDSGILSASTLSWWAARIAHAQSRGNFVAPKYWTNWSKKDWANLGLKQSSFLTWA